MPKKRDFDGTVGKNGPSDGSSKRQRGDEDAPSVNEQILEALQTQNGLLKDISDGLKSQNELLKNIDACLGRKEAQEQGSSNQRGRSGGPSLSKRVVGSWKFVETIESNSGKKRSYFGRVDKKQGEEEGIELLGVRYHQNEFPRHRRRCLGPPLWSTNTSHLCPTALKYDNKRELGLKTGIYFLKIKYNCSNPKRDYFKDGAGVIVGGVEFSSEGFVVAEGADWDRLLNNEKQTQLPYSHGAKGNRVWSYRKICMPWEDGDEIEIEIDTNENTIFFRRGDTPKKALRNILAFSNNHERPEYLSVLAYCGWREINTPYERIARPDIKLTIIP